MDGILVIDKPQGPTSHDVVHTIRCLLKEKKVGHTGTLDPAATGVLPLMLGQATKISQYLICNEKTYEGVVKLGQTTTTLDAEGEILKERPVDISREVFLEVLKLFRGGIEQIPPMYSAKKIAGQKLYELARKGIEVVREPKKVEIHSLELLQAEGVYFTIRLSCSAGTYVRTLAHDIGEKLGCGAHLFALRRLQAKPFDVSQAISLEALKEDPSLAKGALISIGDALKDIRRLELPQHLSRLIQVGYQLSVADLRKLSFPIFSLNDTLAFTTDAGAVLAIARAQINSDDLSGYRRERKVFKTERLFQLAS